MGESAEAQRLAKSALNDALLGGIMSAVGFGLCRAWIVFCLSAAALSIGTHEANFNWLFLLTGAITAFACAALAKRAEGLSPASLARACAACIGASCAVVVVAQFAEASGLLLVGIAIGGVGAGLLQVAWGDRFSAHNARFVLACAPSAAIVTGTLLAIASADNVVAVLTALPLASLCLLALSAAHDGESLGLGIALFGRESDGAQSVSQATPFERERERERKRSAALSRG